MVMQKGTAKAVFEDISAQFNADRLEREALQFWEEDKTFEKSLEQRKGKKLFVFYDGPPYATGKPHHGHILQSALKDAVLRYKTMRGYYVPRRVGWDTHGLPVEVMVEKELGLKTKKDVEKYGIEKFNQKCREAVFRYIDLFRETLQRMGRWADYEHGYATLDRDYMEREWGVFKQMWDKGLIYKDFRSTPYCVRCATPLSNFETSMAYKDRTDRAVYVRLKAHPEQSRRVKVGSSTRSARSESDKQVYLLIWTTTPWTLPANVAVAVSKDLAYVSVEHGGEEYIIAKDRVKAVFGNDVRIVKEWTLDELLGLRYEGLYEPGERAKLYRVVLAEHVTAEDGTGLVHMAPAFGVEDFEVGKREGLSTLRTVDTDGRYTVDPWVGKSLWKVNDEVAADLKQRGLLFKEEQYTHSYPHCWRCDTPLIYYALDSWFVKVTDLKEKMLAANEEIRWIPEHIKHGRFAKGIESAPDWAVSRNRFWSTPMPVWECEKCREFVAVGSVAELQKLSGVGDVPDLHRPYVDDITWAHGCSGTMRRIPEVLDVWFDSGSMPYATGAEFPADFIVESIEMTRAWFYTLHVLAVALQGSAAYKNVIGSGIIFGSDGNKLSKKLKNYPEVEPTIEKYGADTVRMFFLGGTLGEPYVFSEKELQQLYRNFTMRLWNVHSFFVQYANVQNWTKKKAQISKHKAQTILDRWVLARLKQLEWEVIKACEEYRFDMAARMFIPFVDDLSNWYVRRSRERFHPASAKATADKAQGESAFLTLHEVLVRLAKLLAPFMPFLTETMYRNLTKNDSVHLQNLDEVSVLSDDERTLLADMARARSVASRGLGLRAQAGMKVRQLLAEVVVSGKPFSSEITGVVRDELNVQEVKFAEELPQDDEKYRSLAAEGQLPGVALRIELTPELARSGLAREIIRRAQSLRRKAGYKLDDKICIVVVAEGEQVSAVVAEYQNDIMAAVQALSLSSDRASEEDVSDDFDLAGERVHLGVRKS